MTSEERILHGNDLYDRGLQAFRHGEQERSRELNHASLALFREMEDATGTAKALVGLARVAIRDHDFDAVGHYATEAAALLEGREEPRIHAAALHMLAAVARMSGDDAEAARLYERTASMYCTIGHEAGVAGELMNQGYARLHLGEMERARLLFTESLERTSALGDRVAIAFCVASCAAFASAVCDDERAALLYGAALFDLKQSGIVLDPDDQSEYDRYSSAARARVGDASYTKTELRGRELTRAEALELARQVVAST